MGECKVLTIPNDSSPCDIFYFSDKSPKTAKIETKLLLLSAKISCDVTDESFEIVQYRSGALMQHLENWAFKFGQNFVNFYVFIQMASGVWVKAFRLYYRASKTA